MGVLVGELKSCEFDMSCAECIFYSTCLYFEYAGRGVCVPRSTQLWGSFDIKLKGPKNLIDAVYLCQSSKNAISPTPSWSAEQPTYWSYIFLCILILGTIRSLLWKNIQNIWVSFPTEGLLQRLPLLIAIHSLKATPTPGELHPPIPLPGTEMGIFQSSSDRL